MLDQALLSEFCQHGEGCLNKEESVQIPAANVTRMIFQKRSELYVDHKTIKSIGALAIKNKTQCEEQRE